jgi:hypothetical protein
MSVCWKVGLCQHTGYSKSPHAILDINEESRKWSFGSKKNAKNTWGLLKLIRLINEDIFR